MGCGSSAKPKYAAGAAPATEASSPAPAKDSTAATATEAATVTPVKGETIAPVVKENSAVLAAPKVEKVVSRSSLSVDFPGKSGLEKRRPSLSRDSLVEASMHEGHALIRQDPPTPASSTQRPSTVQTKMELWWMEDIPALYGVSESDSDKLREEIQEDGQADMVKQCVAASADDIPGLLKAWLHDCPDGPGLEKLIKKVIEEVRIMELQKIARSNSGKVTFGRGDSSTSNSTDGERSPKPLLQRKGTGFVSAGQVKSLMAQDYGSSSEEESDQDQDDDAFEQELAKKLDKSSGARAAVASEAHEVDDDWVPPVYEKTPAQRARIAEAVSDSFMFAALSHDQLQPLLDAFQEIRVEPGTKVIEEGCLVGAHDRGLYVFESGEMDVYKKGKEAAVFTYTEIGQNFGEIALLYNAPRSATVIATKPSVLWCIDRMTFNVLVKDAVKKAKDRRFNFLKSVELLETLTDDEIAKIGDALRERTYGTGVHIIEEGTEGDVFFILEKGMAAAIKNGSRVMEYRPSDYFGELALLKDVPRAADIITQEDCTVLSLNRSAFQRLLGPLDSMMSERMAQYDEADMVKKATGRESWKA